MKPIFMESWWMDAVCAGKHWEEILPNMPCLIRDKWWMRWICMPQQTQIGGMWLDRSTCTLDDVKKHAQEIDAKLRELRLNYYYQQYPIGSVLPLEMKELGYKVKERVTYRLEDLSDLDKVINAFSKNQKRQLQKALSLHGERGMNVEEFYQFHVDCMAQRKHQVSYSREFLLVLDRKVKRQQQGEIITIRNVDGEVYAAAYVVWDKEALYYLIPCYSELHKDSGASAMLVLEAIKMAREKGLQFDFEGSMKRGIANHYKQFGAKPMTYYSVEKIFRWPFVLMLVANWFRNLKFGI